MQRFPVGTKFKPIGKTYVCTVTDFLVTKNLAGEVVKICYVATYTYCGQPSTMRDVTETTIARGILV